MTDSGYSGNIPSIEITFQDESLSSKSTEEQKKLLEAAKTGDLKEVKRLVGKCHVELDSAHEQNPQCDTPLHLAACYSHVGVVKYFVENEKCDVMCKNRQGKTPLHCAARRGQLEVVKYLIVDGKSDPICVCSWNRTPLHHACEHGRLEVVKYLMENDKVDALAKENRYGLTSLDLAAENGALEVVQYIIEEKKCIEGHQREGSNTPLHQAAFGGRLEIVQYLITNKVYNPMCKGRRDRTPLHSACKSNKLEVVKYYMDTLQVKVDSSCQDNNFNLSPLDMAAEHGALDVLKYMVEEKHCTVEHEGQNQNSALHQAAYGGKLEVVKYLTQGGHCNPAHRGWRSRTPLHSACRSGKNDVVDYLIEECKVDASTKDEMGKTPLHSAVKSGNKSVVKLLITKFNCNPEVINNKGRTPAEDALRKGHKGIWKYLTSFQEISSNEVHVSLKSRLKMFITNARPTTKVLGRGSFGSVIELRTDEGLVAGKVFNIVHAAATRLSVPRVIKEIETISYLNHPHIVTSKGVCFLPDKIMPVLLMELLTDNLHTYILHPDNSNLPVERKLPILHDTASGLDYLHRRTPAIIHRDLTAKNVLLNSESRAKIADFGNSRIMDLDPDCTPEVLTNFPGTLEYMPPEARESRGMYDPSLDVFSFGHLSLFTITQTPVRPLPPTYHDLTGKLHARSEVKRRAQFVEAAEQLLSENQSLVALIKRCLHNKPALRPHTGELLTRLQKMMAPGSEEVDSETDNNHTEKRNSATGGDTTATVLPPSLPLPSASLPSSNLLTGTTSSSRPRHRREKHSPDLPAKRPRLNLGSPLLPHSAMCTQLSLSVWTSESPSLPELLHLNIPQEVGANYNYFTFGISLLNDKTGSRVSTIEDECRANPGRIVWRILQEWLQGKGLPVTWESLIHTLRDTDLPALADKIETISRAH